MATWQVLLVFLCYQKRELTNLAVLNSMESITENPTKVGDKLFDPVEKTLSALKTVLETDDDETEIVCGHSLSLLMFRRRAIGTEE